MVPFLLTPREHHSVRSPEEYRAHHAAFIARKATRGARFTVHEIATPVTARVDAGTWLIDCECLAGNAVDPEWPIACCYGCGAVHTAIVFPTASTRAVAEDALLVRTNPFERHWHPARQSIEDLERWNRTRGLLPRRGGSR